MSKTTKTALKKRVQKDNVLEQGILRRFIDLSNEINTTNQELEAKLSPYKEKLGVLNAQKGQVADQIQAALDAGMTIEEGTFTACMQEEKPRKESAKYKEILVNAIDTVCKKLGVLMTKNKITEVRQSLQRVVAVDLKGSGNAYAKHITDNLPLKDPVRTLVVRPN